MADIITMTPNPALDVTTVVDKVDTNKKLRCNEPRRDPGGGGVNVSRALKHLGMHSTAIYTKGGSIGDIYYQLLEKEGVDQNPVAIKSMMRENVVVREKENNDLYRFGMPGAELKESEWQELIEKVESFTDSKYLIASGSLPPGVPDDFYNQLSAKAKEYNIRFVLDTSKEPLRKILSEGAFMIKPNAEELNHLVNADLRDRNDQKEAIREIVSKYPVEVIVISLGGDGAIMATKDGVEDFQAPSVQKKSSVGAGDSMVAGMVYQLNRDKEINEVVKYGLACGGAALKTGGTELLHQEDVAELMKELESI